PGGEALIRSEYRRRSRSSPHFSTITCFQGSRRARPVKVTGLSVLSGDAITPVAGDDPSGREHGTRNREQGALRDEALRLVPAAVGTAQAERMTADGSVA